MNTTSRRETILFLKMSFFNLSVAHQGSKEEEEETQEENW